MNKLYVAYGSNLNVEQMAYRCPYARILSVGVLHNWKLVFRGVTGNSYATIVRCKEEQVPVVVWEITPYDEYRLDIYEGYPRFYYKQNVMVQTKEDGVKKAMVYIMNDNAAPGTPSPSYINTIKSGYVQNELNMNYLQNAIARNKKECNQKRGCP